jgi:hypothetical protein
VLFSELHLLQRLIYIESEPAEQVKEKGLVSGRAAEEQMLIHFIKHLVRITTRRNSFYVTLGINRLLYNYTTAETMDTFNAVIQDPARVKDDYYYRSRKGVLMQELKNRFGGFLDVVRGARGEERFRSSERQSSLSELVRECLSLFTPWDTFCLVPAGVNPIVDGIADFSSHGKKEEDKIEVDRIHAVLHPDCYTRLMGLLGFDSPDRRLEAPQFFLSTDSNVSGDGPGGRRRSHSDLTNSELNGIKAHLDDQSARRKRVAAGMLRILVDGKEQARFAPSRSASSRFELEHDAEMIEIRSIVDGDDLLLASHLFTHNEPVVDARPEVTSIALEGGQRIAIKVTPTEDASKTIIDVEYRETALLRLASLYLKRPVSSPTVGEPALIWRWNTVRVSTVALGIALLFLSVFGVARFTQNRNTGTSPESAKSDKPVQAPANEPGIQVEVPESTAGDLNPPNNKQSEEEKTTQQEPVVRSSDSSNARGTDTQQENVSAAPAREEVVRDSSTRVTPSSTNSQIEQGMESTRGLPSRPSAVTVAEVTKIYVEVVGKVGLRSKLRQNTLSRLSESNRFSTAPTKDDADALLRLTVNKTRNAKGKVFAQVVLINDRGGEIWRSTRSREILESSIDSVAADIVGELLDYARTVNKRQ